MSKIVVAVLAALSIMVAAPSAAQEILLGVGGRAGATLDPDQVHVGVHFDLGELADRVRFCPNLEVGFGSDLTLVALNPEVVYLFQTSKARWTPYAGGGLGINILNWDKSSSTGSGTDVEVGLNLLAGFETKVNKVTRLFIEGKLGVGDSPDFKISVGFTLLR